MVTATIDRNGARLDRQFARLEQRLPAWVGRFLRWLRQPASRWVRLPISVLLVCGGVFSILPILGLWMIPLGLLLMAQDLPFLRRPTGRALVRVEYRWRQWIRRRNPTQLSSDKDPAG